MSRPLPSALFEYFVKISTLVVASKKIGLEINADKNKYMVMSGDQDVGRSHNVKIDKSLKTWNSSDVWEQH
jgi:hypothetical protein